MAKISEIGPYSAYAIAVANGFTGTEQEWLASLVGSQGPQGASVTGAKIDASQHLIITVHDPATGGDTEIDAGEIGTTEAVQAVQQAIQQAGQSAVSAVENAVTSAGTQAVSAIGSARQTAVQQVQQAGQESIASAQQEAEKASSSATQAGESASAAASSASAAQQSQSAASSSATQAGESASAAKGSEDAAAASATAAAASEVNAEDAAGRAEQAAQNSGLPQPTPSDAGKVPTVNDAGTSYELRSTLEKNISDYYAMRRTGKVYQTRLWKFAANPTSTGEKLLDNAGLVFEPSTDTEEGQDDYLNGRNPLFVVV